MNKNFLRAIELCEIPSEESYLNSLPVVKYLARMKTLSFNAPVTFLVGENGTGKSTLLEAIAVAMGFNPEGGSRNFTFSTNDSHSGLWKCIDTVKGFAPRDGYFLRAESLYNVWLWCKTAFSEMDYTFWTNPKRHFRPCVYLHLLQSLTVL